MARRSSVLDDISNLPWPVGVVLALLCYPGAVFFASTLDSNPALSGVGSAFLAIWPVFSILFLLAAFASFFKDLKKKKLFRQNQSLEKIRGLNWRQFEQYVGEYFKEQGYFVVETSEGPDGGVDLVLRRDGEKTYVQCKHWKFSKVGVDKIRAFLGSMVSGGAQNGIFVITGLYSQEAKQFGVRNGIELIDGSKLEKMINPGVETDPTPDISQPQTGSLLCPICEAPMVERITKRGPNVGKKFWGCSTFPPCRGRREIEA